MDKKDLTEQEEQEIVRYIGADRPSPDKYRSLLSDDKREKIRVRDEGTGEWEERWTRDFVFENDWLSHYTKTDRSIELTSAFYECTPGRRKLAVKVVDIVGNVTMTIVEVTA